MDAMTTLIGMKSKQKEDVKDKHKESVKNSLARNPPSTSIEPSHIFIHNLYHIVT